VSHNERVRHHHGREDRHLPHHVTVTVFSPRDPEPRSFTWPVDWTVGQAADAAAAAFGYQGGEPTLGKGNETLSRELALRQAHIHNHDQLELLDVGGGV
jgi:hypothetical protein